MTETVNRHHVAVVMGHLFAEMTRVFDDPSWAGVRVSHIRILESLAPEGSRVTELASALRMTKQGAGQLVAGLLALGLVEQRPDAHDRRAKVVALTPPGREVVARAQGEIAALEGRWAAQVGHHDYATFRSVLDRIVDDIAGPDEGTAARSADGPASPD